MLFDEVVVGGDFPDFTALAPTVRTLPVQVSSKWGGSYKYTAEERWSGGFVQKHYDGNHEDRHRSVHPRPCTGR